MSDRTSTKKILKSRTATGGRGSLIFTVLTSKNCRFSFKIQKIILGLETKFELFENNHCNTNIVDISGAFFTLSFSIPKMNSQCEESARDVVNIRVTVVKTATFFWYGL